MLSLSLSPSLSPSLSQDLARAFVLALGNPKAYGQVYNISGPKYVTFDGIAKACAEAMGKKVEIVHFNPKDFDFGKKKGFPLRDQVCVCVHKCMWFFWSSLG